MPLLNCTVKNCLYNKDEYCAKGDILVDGRTAKMSEGTSCKALWKKEKAQAIAVDAVVQLLIFR